MKHASVWELERSAFGSIHPQGWVPIETTRTGNASSQKMRGSIHPQGWVPIETRGSAARQLRGSTSCSIHPQGWVPIETSRWELGGMGRGEHPRSIHPQGWVPIETARERARGVVPWLGSIHPQGWVPIETKYPKGLLTWYLTWYITGSIHPQGWVPIETPV